MKNIVIIGQSPAAHAAVQALLDRDPSMGITLISTDMQLPYDRSRLPGLIDKSLKETDLFCAPAEFYAASRVEVISDREVSRINVNRRRVFLSAKTHVDFDALIVADGNGPRWPAVKGVRRQGVFHLARLAVVRDLVRYLALAETVMIEPIGFAGIRAALALKAVGKDVIVAVRQETLLAGMLAPDRALALGRALEQRGIRMTAGAVDDVIGEVEVKAVRLKSGKVMACDMFVTEDVAPDLRFFDDTLLASEDTLAVDGACQTAAVGIYGVDAACRVAAAGYCGAYAADPRAGVRQAAVAVAGMFGDPAALSPEDNAPVDRLDELFLAQELAPAPSEVVA